MRKLIQLAFYRKIIMAAGVCLLPFFMKAHVLVSPGPGAPLKESSLSPEKIRGTGTAAVPTSAGEERLTDPQAERIITGKVTSEEGEPLPGATVALKGTAIATTTSADGTYSLTIPDASDEEVIVVSFIGFASKEVPIENRTILDVVLEYDNNQLDEVVVVGYGTQKRRDVVGSISTIKAEDITKVPATSFADAMQGKASGLYIASPSGHPGRGAEVKIRGKGSINLSSEPLWIIDGVPVQTGSLDLTRNGVRSVSPLTMINPNDIESIQVLKDAAATSIYGNRGSNGVIIVTTRSASSGGTGISINYDGGMSEMPVEQNDIYLTSKEWWETVDKAWANAGNTSLYQPGNIIDGQFLDEKPPMTREEAMNVNTDHLGALTQTAGYQQLGLTANKGFETGGVMFSLNYRDEKGLMRNNNLQRLTGRLNFNFSPVESLELGINSNLMYLSNQGVQTGNGKGLGGWDNWVAMMPWFKLYDENSATGYWAANSGFNGLAFSDPDLIRNETDQYRTISNAYLNWSAPVKGLSLRSEIGVDLLINNGSYWKSELLDANAPFANEAAERSVTRKIINYNAYLNYNRTFGESNFSATAGAEGTRQNDYTRYVEGTQIYSNYPELRNPLQITDGDGYRGGEQYLMGLFGRANYTFRDRYILNASIRRDGHSVLSKENRWATFTAVGAGWIITEEDFFEIPGISLLKLRASYGTTGNTSLSTEMIQTSWGLSPTRYGGGYLPGGTTVGPIGTPGLRWETTTNLDVGIDFGLLDDRISGSVAYYTKDVSDLILRGEVPPSTGYSSNFAWENIGDLKNWGWEFDVTSYNIRNENFSWNTDFNISFNDNKIIELNEFEQGKGAEGSQTIRKIGEKLDTWYLADYMHIDPERGIAMIEQRDAVIWDTEFRTIGNGHLIPMNAANVNANKMIQHGKSALPTFFGGMTNRFTYKGFDLNIQLVFAGGHYKINSLYERGRRLSPISNIVRVDGKIWEKPGDIADYPELRWGNNFPYDNEGNYSSNGTNFETANHTFWLEKANYLRIRNVQLGYSLPASILSKIKVQNLRVYVGGMNLHTFTKFRGIDPESNSDVPLPRNYNLGLSINL